MRAVPLAKDCAERTHINFAAMRIDPSFGGILGNFLWDSAHRAAGRPVTAALVETADSDNYRLLIRRNAMVDPALRRARLVRELEQDFVADYDAQSLPSADKRAAYALEHIAFRVGRIEQSLARLATAVEAILAKG